MKNYDTLFERLKSFAFNTWYVAGLIGWVIVFYNYPLMIVIPRYAGG